MAKTLQDALDIAYGIIAQGQDSTAYPTDLLITFINKAQNDICAGNVQNLSTNERLVKQSLTFLEKNQFYSTNNYSTLATDVNIGDTSISCTNTLSASGYLWINGNIISYSGNDGSTISGIPATGEYAVQFPFTAGTQVFQINELPSDFNQVERAFLTMNQTRARIPLVSVDSRNLNSPIPNSYLYRFFFDRSYSNGTGLGREWYYSLLRGRFVFFLVPQTNAQPISLEYQKKPTQLSDPEDLLTIPDEYSLSTIPYMAIAEMLANRGDMDQAIMLNNFGFQNIKSMFEYYNSQRTELMYGQRVRNASEGFLNF